MKKTAAKKKKETIDPEIVARRKALSKIILGCFVFILALFTLFACVSYIFTWKTDQSLLTDPSMMDSATSVGNMSGKFGIFVHMCLK